MDTYSERRRNRTGQPELQDTRTQSIVLRLIRGTAPKGTGDIGAVAVLRRPAFRWLLAGTTLSNGAQWIQQVTLSWLIYDLTGSGALWAR